MSAIKPKHFVHVVYRTFQFDKMIKWYQTVFNAEVQFQNEMIAFLTYDAEHHRFAFANLSVMMPAADAPEKRNKVGVDHVAYTYGSLRDLLENWERLKMQGVEPYWCLHHGVTISLYYADPDNNQMEFQVDCYETPEEANEFMRSEGYAKNPLGVEFDPANWLARLRSGEPEDGFYVRQIHHPVTPVRGNLVV